MFLLICLPVSAKGGTVNGFTYEVKTDNTAEITDCNLTGDIVIPSSIDGYTVTSLAKQLFYGQYSITSVSIPSTVTYFGDDPNDNMWDYVFSYCYSLKKITVASDNPVFRSVDGVLYSKDMKKLINYPANKAGSSYHVPAQTDVLCCTSFASSRNLQSLYLDGLDTYWMTYTFYDTGQLTVYFLPGGYAETRAKMFMDNGLAYESNKNYCKFREFVKMTGMSIITPKGEVANGTVQKANVGESYTYTISPKPSNASNAVTWKSSDTSIATVTSAGRVTIKAVGTVKIIVTAQDGSGVMASFTLKCDPIKATEIVISNSSGTTLNGKTITTNSSSYQLKAVVRPSSANQSVSWVCTNGTGVAEVNAAGKVTFKKSGTVTITAKARDGSGVNASFTLKYAPVKATEIYVYNENNTLLNNKTFSTNKAVYQLQTNARPANALQSFGYVSSDTSVALVHPTEGKITFLKPGTTTITVNTRDASGVKTKFTITYIPIKTTKLNLYGPEGQLLTGKSVTTKTRIYKLNAVAQPSTALQYFSWISSDPSIATVNFYGTVGFHKPGTVKIQAGARDASGHRATVTIKYAP